MYERVTVPRAVPVVSVVEQCSFAHIDLPLHYTADSPPQVSQEWLDIESFIEAATDQVETLAATALVTEQIELTFDFWPNQQDPRLTYNNLLYSNSWIQIFWHGFTSKDSIELVRRPVQTGGSPPRDLVVTYNDPSGVLQTLDPATYTVRFDKITLNVGCIWPPTDRRQDCIQINYHVGYGDASADVPARLKLAVKYLSGHFYDHRTHVIVEKTNEVTHTLSSLIGSFKSYRIPK